MLALRRAAASLAPRLLAQEAAPSLSAAFNCLGGSLQREQQQQPGASVAYRGEPARPGRRGGALHATVPIARSPASGSRDPSSAASNPARFGLGRRCPAAQTSVWGRHGPLGAPQGSGRPRTPRRRPPPPVPRRRQPSPRVPPRPRSICHLQWAQRAGGGASSGPDAHGVCHEEPHA